MAWNDVRVTGSTESAGDWNTMIDLIESTATSAFITNSKGHAFTPTGSYVQSAIADVGPLGDEDGGFPPESTAFYVPKHLRGWVRLPAQRIMTINATLTVNPYIELDFNGSTLVMISSTDALQMKIGSWVHNGEISVSKVYGGLSTYTASIIKIVGTPNIGMSVITQIDNMHIQGSHLDPGYAVPFKGIGIHLYIPSTESGELTVDQNIGNVRVSNCSIERTIWAIRLENGADGVTHSGWINANYFDNISIDSSLYGIELTRSYSGDNVHSAIWGNYFTRIDYQTADTWHASYGYSQRILRTDGAGNIFSHWQIWDWGTTVLPYPREDACIQFTADTDDMVLIGSGWSTRVSDLGSNNYILDWQNNCRTERSGTASASNGDTISHGLWKTPTAYFAQSKTAQHICNVTAASSTTLTISLYDNSGNAVTADESIVWWAKVTNQ